MMRHAVLAAVLGACNASTGVLTLELTTAPGSDLLSRIDRLRLTLSHPAATFEATRTASGLDLAFEIEAVESDGVLSMEAFDGSGELLAVGQSPPFPLAGTDGAVVIYMAPPYSILQGPVDLSPARWRVAGAPLVFGAVLTGGDVDGEISASMTIYNVYNHTFAKGADMPMPRSNVTLAANDSGGIYILGGTDEQSGPTSTLYRFQSNIAPAGVYSDLGAHPGLESQGQRAIALGPDRFFVTGAQPALISDSTITPIDGLGDVPPVATAATTRDGEPLAAYVDASLGVGYYTASGESDAFSAGEGSHIVAGPTPGTATTLGGSRNAYIVDLEARTATLHPDVLSVARRLPTVTRTARHILVANGFAEDSTLIPSADILDAKTLALLATVPLYPRAFAVAVPMTNGQILIAGGESPNEPPTGLVELFTPPTDPALP